MVLQEMKEPIEAIAGYFREGIKPVESQSLGLELELLTLSRDLDPKSFLGKQGIHSALETLLQKPGWSAGESHAGALFSLNHEMGSLTLEPGCQIELSATPNSSLFELEETIAAYLQEIMLLGESHDIDFFGIGLNPLVPAKDIPLLPKYRYELMDNLFQRTGKLGQYMMRNSASLQVCIDYFSEEDLLAKLNLSFQLCPFVRALFSNSPFMDGVKSEFKCMRGLVWQNTDPDRQGIPEVIFKKDLSLEDYCTHLLNTPAIFYQKQGEYIAAEGKNFLECYPAYLELDSSNLESFFEDFHLHRSQSFLETRVRNFLEFRTADAQIQRFFLSVPAFYKGIFFDPDSILATQNLLADYDRELILELFQKVPQAGLNTPLHSYLVLDVVKELLEISRQGLERQSKTLGRKKSEGVFLDSLQEIVVENGYCPADFLLRIYHQECGSNLSKLMQKIRYQNHKSLR
jgi:glutamate--cysteine ligase